MEFTCKCGKKDYKSYGSSNLQCGDCIGLEFEEDEPRRREKIISLMNDLKGEKPLTHSEARIATTTPGMNYKDPDIGSVYLSKLINKVIPLYTYNTVYRVGEKHLVDNCIENGLWPWARYKRDSGDFAYICLYIEP